MRPITKTLLRYGGAMAIVAAASVMADLFSRLTGTSRMTSIFLSSVLLSALYLGRGPGYLAAALALVAHLYLVDPPYAFSLGSMDEFNALALFLAASILICLLAGRLRGDAAAARARGQVTTAMLEATREFSATDDEQLIRRRLAYRLQRIGGGKALVREALAYEDAPEHAVESEALLWAGKAERAMRKGGAQNHLEHGWTFRGLIAGDQVFGVAGWRAADGETHSADVTYALELLTDTGAAAIARARLAAAKAEVETRARSEDLRNALLSSISHDLRTPLSGIMGSASTLRRFAEEFDVPTRRDLAATIEEEAARLDATVSNLLQMTRLQSGGVPLKRIGFSLPETVRATVAHRTKGDETLVKVTAEPKLPDALGDPTLFEQALGNVIDNALRYARAGGPISVDARRGAEGLVVEVQDGGPGVAEQDLERIFDRFFRSAAGERVHGTGLGLAIARGLVEAMGGRVAAYRRPDAPGLLVRFTVQSAAP